MMLFEAFVSFLGTGRRAAQGQLGACSRSTRTEAINPVKTFWWLVAWPAAAMASTLLALNILGDGLRDALDPKLRATMTEASRCSSVRNLAVVFETPPRRTCSAVDRRVSFDLRASARPWGSSANPARARQSRASLDPRCD